jgi:hypothetical protein
MQKKGNQTIISALHNLNEVGKKCQSVTALPDTELSLL